MARPTADGLEMTRMVDNVRDLYNHVRPHQTLAGDRPIQRYLTTPTATSSTR